MTALRDDDVRRLLRPLIRSRTVLEPIDTAPERPSLTATRFGGLPTVQRGEDWPACAACRAAMTFVCQINTRDARHDMTPVTFFTFFYCWRCHPWGKDEEQGQWAVRAYRTLTMPQALASQTREVLRERYPAARGERSLPDAAGMQLHCPQLWRLVPGTSGSRAAWANWEVVNRVALHLTGERARAPHLRNAGVALGGYPYWANGRDETPGCPDCDQPMELLLQIRPTELLDRDWGDVATAYLFICRTHTRRTGLRIKTT